MCTYLECNGYKFFSKVVGVLLLLAMPLSCYAQLHKRDSLLNVINLAEDIDGKVNTRIELSKWYINADFPKAIEVADEALSIANRVGNPTVLSSALSQRALLFWNNGQYDSSINFNRRAMTLYKQDKDTLGIADTYFGIAMNYYYSADYDSAIFYHQLALGEYTGLKDHRRIAEVLNLIGLVYHQMGNYPQAIFYLHEFSRARQNISGYQGRTYNLGNSTPYFRSREYFESELKLQLEAFAELKEVNDQEKLYLTYLNIADTYKELLDYENALNYHKQAARFAEEIGLVPEYTYLGNAYRAAGKIDSALYIHHMSLNIVKSKNTELKLLNLYGNLGKDFEVTQEYDKALKNFRVALEMTTTMNNKLDIVVNSHRVVRALFALGRYEESKVPALSALQYAQKIKAKTYVRDSYLLLAEIEAALHNYENAYAYQKANKTISDSLVAGESELQFAKMQAEFELDKKNRDIELLAQEKELQEAVIRNKDQLIIGFIIVLSLSILLAVSAYLRYQQKIRANKILVEQKHQIEILLSEVHHRVKNNLQIISSLLSIQSDQLKDVNARMAVLEGQSRVQAMGLIHENIYKTENFSFIQMDEYLKKMSAKLIESFGFDEDRIKVILRAQGISLDVDTAIHIGLIINELVTNSLKHAFKDIPNPGIWIKLCIDENHLLALEVRDNGKGFLATSGHNSFGLKLVTELSAQMGGTIAFQQDNGLVVSVRLTKFKSAA